MRIAALACVLLLSACGFQLQGRQVMPASLVTLRVVAVDQQSDFTRALRTALKASGSRLVEENGADGASVRIVREVLAENVPMLNLVRRLGFTVRQEPESPTVFAVIRTL